MKPIVVALLACVLVSVSGYAMAQTLVGTSNDPTGIDGLVIDGTTYNVTFSTTTYQSPFMEGSAGGAAAAAAMATALSSLGVTALAGVTPVQCPPMSNECQFNSILFVAVDNAPSENTDVAQCTYGPSPTDCSLHSWSGRTNDITGSTFGSVAGLGPLTFDGSPVWGYGYAANFTHVGIPEPGSLSLLVLGLAGVGLVRRRKVR